MSSQHVLGPNDRAMFLVLEKIDAAEKAAYHPIAPRNKMLQSLIDEHNLQHVNVDDLFNKGSVALGRNYLARIGYGDVAAPSKGGKAGKSKGAKEGQKTKASAAQKMSHAHPAQSAAGPSQAVMASHEPAASAVTRQAEQSGDELAVSDGKRKRSQTDQADAPEGRPTKRARSPEIAPTPSPLSPTPDTASPFQKRQGEESYEPNKKRKSEDMASKDAETQRPRKSPKLTNEDRHAVPESAAGVTDPEAADFNRKRKSDEIDRADDQLQPARKSAKLTDKGTTASSTATSTAKKANDTQQEQPFGKAAAPDPVPAKANGELKNPEVSASASAPTAPASGPAGPQLRGTAAFDLTGENGGDRSSNEQVEFNEADNTDAPGILKLFTRMIDGALLSVDENWAPPPSTGPVMRHLQTAGDSRVSDDIGSAWFNCQEISAWFQDKTGLDYKDAPEWIMDPSPELERLLAVLYGKRWRRTVQEMGKRHAAGKMFWALPAAALWAYVWDKPLPWMGAKERAAMFAGQEHFWNQYVRGFTPSGDLNIETLAYGATERMYYNEDFWDEHIIPVAQKLADKTWHTISPQYFAQPGVSDVQKDVQPKALWRFMQEKLEKAFFKVLVLKGLFECAGQYYGVEWVESGTPFDPKTMALHWDKLKDPQNWEVAFCVTPRVTRQETKDSPKRIISMPTVFVIPKLRPDIWPEGAD